LFTGAADDDPSGIARYSQAGAQISDTMLRTVVFTVHLDRGMVLGAVFELRPVAGEFTFLLFSLGIIGTSPWAVPVLAGSAGDAVAEAAGWPGTLRARLGRGEACGF
jgi:Mn2+/Fe2+ NRAMP family transporter